MCKGPELFATWPIANKSYSIHVLPFSSDLCRHACERWSTGSRTCAPGHASATLAGSGDKTWPRSRAPGSCEAISSGLWILVCNRPPFYTSGHFIPRMPPAFFQAARHDGLHRVKSPSREMELPLDMQLRGGNWHLRRAEPSVFLFLVCTTLPVASPDPTKLCREEKHPLAKYVGKLELHLGDVH